MDIKKTFLDWPVLRQLTGPDPLGRGAAVQSARTAGAARRAPRPPTGSSERLPVLRGRLRPEGLRQGRDGHPDRGRPGLARSRRGRLCPKGSASKQLVNSARPRRPRCCYRRPHGTEWEDLDLDTAMDMIADRVVETRDAALAGRRTSRAGALRRTMGIASLGGATLDNEENYLIKKLFTAMGAIQIENQARI